MLKSADVEVPSVVVLSMVVPELVENWSTVVLLLVAPAADKTRPSDVVVSEALLTFEVGVVLNVVGVRVVSPLLEVVAELDASEVLDMT